jgi:hypothetical protein
MSRNTAGIPVIEAEGDSRCELCGKLDETRPYGPNGERVCFECGMKDEEAAKRQMNKYLFGEGNA